MRTKVVGLMWCLPNTIRRTNQWWPKVVIKKYKKVKQKKKLARLGFWSASDALMFYRKVTLILDTSTVNTYPCIVWHIVAPCGYVMQHLEIIGARNCDFIIDTSCSCLIHKHIQRCQIGHSWFLTMARLGTFRAVQTAVIVFLWFGLRSWTPKGTQVVVISSL